MSPLSDSTANNRLEIVIVDPEQNSQQFNQVVSLTQAGQTASGRGGGSCPSSNTKQLSERVVADLPRAWVTAHNRGKLGSLYASTKELIDLVKGSVDPIFNVVPSCGWMCPIRFVSVMIALMEASYCYPLPKHIVSIGSGQAFTEKCLSQMENMQVSCFDRDSGGELVGTFMPVTKAVFPQDIAKCLPDDCSNCILFSGYPQGYLGAVLEEYIRRNGKYLCTTVEESLFTDMHEGYGRDSSILRRGVEKLRKDGQGECFQVRLGEPILMAPATFIQFYNWPTFVKQSLLEASRLNGLCSDIEFVGGQTPKRE